MTYKRIILSEKGVRAFKEAKPENNFSLELEHEYHSRLLEWSKSGIDIEFYPGQEDLIRTQLAIKYAWKEFSRPDDITDFCEIREVSDPYNKGFISTYAFFKSPKEEEAQEYIADKEYFQDIYQNGKFLFSFSFSKTVPYEKECELVSKFLKAINNGK